MRRAIFCILALLFLSVLLSGYQSGDGILEMFFNSRDGQVPVYRFFNTARGGHLYTISEVERDYIMENLPQWTYEGIKFDVHETQAEGTCAVYRFFNTRTGIHFYTINEAERDEVMQLDHYNYEGIKYYVYASFATDTTPVYRFFNHVRGGHLYTISEHERDTVMQLPNWTYEGISFYVYPHQESTFAPVPRTGQTTPYRDGDDGDYQMGVQWPVPRFTDHGNGTVTDKLTGLMWTKNANIDGQKTWDDAIDWCNSLTHGGRDDWRLPNRRELFSLLDRGEYSPGLPDGHPFINVQNWYWSSSTYAGDTDIVWYVGIDYGDSWFADKTNTIYTWAVRGVSHGPAPVPRTGQSTSYRTGDDGDYQMGVSLPVPRFTDNGDGTVTDNLTGLMWAKDANIDGYKTWDDAIDYCNALDHAGHDDWRLPNILELHSLIDIAHYGAALPDGHPFTGVQSYHYWSSTTLADVTDGAWYVNLDSGYVYCGYKTGTHYAWPVRGGQ